MEWEEVDLRIDVEDILNVLPERYKSVIIKRFYESKTLKAIGNDLGVTPERIRQMEAKALLKIKLRTKYNETLREYYLR